MGCHMKTNTIYYDKGLIHIDTENAFFYSLPAVELPNF